MISTCPTYTVRPVLKVLHITTDFVPGTGGLEKFILDLATQSRSAGIDPSILALNKIAGSDAILTPDEIIAGLTVHRVRFFDLKYYKPTWLPIRLMKSADVLHVHGIGALLDFVVATKPIHRKPIVLSTHGGIFHNATLSGLKNAYFGLVRTMILSFVDRVVACGEADRQLFAAHGVREMITIDNGIDLKPSLALSQETPRKVARVTNRLLFVGRISPNKSVDQLIRTVAGARRSGTPATLRIIGPDRYQLNAGLRRLAGELGIAEAVSVVGEIPLSDLPGEYQQADLFVSASRHEGFGISAVEAMAGGAVPLLNDIPAFQYLLKTADGPLAGALCDFADTAKSGRTLTDLLATDRDAMRITAQSRAVDFSWDRLIPRWRELYHSLEKPGRAKITDD